MMLTALLLLPLLSGGATEFVGSTPCDAAPRQFLAIRADAPCERITWELRLADGPPARFALRVVHGVTVPNTLGLERSGTASDFAGSWSRVRGGRDGETIYRLAIDGTGRWMEFRAIGDNLLHPLNARGALMPGNAGWSYTLSRKNALASQVAARTFEPVPASGLSGVQVFEGRTPCRQIAAQLAHSVPADCYKLKWGLTLHHDPSGRAGRYTLEGTLYRDSPRSGTWAALRSAEDAGFILYRLDAGTRSRPLSLYKASDDVLFFVDENGRPLPGDNHFSYTLNRR